MGRTSTTRYHLKTPRLTAYEEHGDDFPTPPWAVRAFFEHVAPDIWIGASKFTVLEPSCGRGHIVDTLHGLGFLAIQAFDSIRYNKKHKIADYTSHKEYEPYDLMLTNPPYKLADQFARRALREARIGVALLMRSTWFSGTNRYHTLFKPFPPTRIGIFSRNMPAMRGQIVRKKAAMMTHAWFWWDKRPPHSRRTDFVWLPPDAQTKLERDEDYL